MDLTQNPTHPFCVSDKINAPVVVFKRVVASGDGEGGCGGEVVTVEVVCRLRWCGGSEGMCRRRMDMACLVTSGVGDDDERQQGLRVEEMCSWRAAGSISGNLAGISP
ncbi:hypothetical protein Tco_1052254 [Tanacetum coccineum]